MPEVRIVLDPQSDSPARRQVFEQIRSAIAQSVLKVGDELPSVRRLAVDLGLHFNTIAGAYRLLAEDGWIEITQGRGARVANREKPAAPTSETVTHYRGRLRQLVDEMRSRGFNSSRIAKELATISEGLK